MAAENVDAIVYSVGRLVKNPTSFAAAFPHGGTELGLVKDVVLLPSKAYTKITAEEFGVEAIDYLDLGESCVCAAILRAPYDFDAMSTIFPQVFPPTLGIPGVTGTVTRASAGTASGMPARKWPPRPSGYSTINFFGASMSGYALTLTTNFGLNSLGTGSGATALARAQSLAAGINTDATLSSIVYAYLFNSSVYLIPKFGTTSISVALTTGGTPGQITVQNTAAPAEQRSGSLLSDRKISLLFAPKDTGRHEAFYLHAALPMLKETAELNQSLDTEDPLEYGVVFAGIRDSNDRMLTQAKLTDIVGMLLE